MLAVDNHRSMGRLLSGFVTNRGIANRPSLPHPTPSLSSGASSSSGSSSEASSSSYSTAYDSGEEARESSRAEVAQRMAPPQQRNRGTNIASSNGLVLPWANGAGCTIVTTSTRRIPLSSSSTPTAAARGSAGKKKRPVLPVSLDSISKDLSKGLNPSQFVQNAQASSQIVTARETEMARNINERSQVQAMLAEQQRKTGSSSSEESSSSGTGKRRRRRRQSSNNSSSSSSSSSSSPRKRGRRTPVPSIQRSNGNPSSNEDIAEDEFFQRDGSGSSSSGSEPDDGRPNLYRVRRRKKNAAAVAAPEEPPKNLCFGCMWGHRQFDRVASTKLNGLADIFDSHFLTSESRELAYLIYLYYQAEIYLPGIKGGKRFPEWTHGQILIHIDEHILEPRVFVARSIRKCIKIQRAMEMFLFEEDAETHRRTYDEKAMKIWLLFNKRQLDLHNCDCKHMFGYSESMQINPSQLSRVVHADRYEVINNNRRGRANVYS